MTRSATSEEFLMKLYSGPLSLSRLHQLAGFGEAKPLESLGRESKGRHYTGSEGSGGRAEGRGRDFWWGLGGRSSFRRCSRRRWSFSGSVWRARTSVRPSVVGSSTSII